MYHATLMVHSSPTGDETQVHCFATPHQPQRCYELQKMMQPDHPPLLFPAPNIPALFETRFPAWTMLRLVQISLMLRIEDEAKRSPTFIFAPVVVSSPFLFVYLLVNVPQVHNIAISDHNVPAG